ncbi:hypothetical protein, partial [Pectobacterium parmentieri]|uniref:hypothetical protein n=1 Tax=Pectobacterium parmentieri TaxID=1905730 RepID=UPI001E5108A6
SKMQQGEPRSPFFFMLRQQSRDVVILFYRHGVVLSFGSTAHSTSMPQPSPLRCNIAANAPRRAPNQRLSAIN